MMISKKTYQHGCSLSHIKCNFAIEIRQLMAKFWQMIDYKAMVHMGNFVPLLKDNL